MLVNVADLVGHPGATRMLERAVDAAELGWDVEGVALPAAVTLDLHLDAVIEGILVRGVVRWSAGLTCSRCTEPVTLEREATIAELFADPRRLDPDDDGTDDGYLLVEDASALDFATLVRDLVLLDLPVRATHPVGTCTPPVVDGVEIRTEDEDAAVRASTPDPRWGALAELSLPDSN